MEEIKDLKDLYALLRRHAIDIKVFQTFSACETNARASHTIAAGASNRPHPAHPFLHVGQTSAHRTPSPPVHPIAPILAILHILAILLQTKTAADRPPRNGEPPANRRAGACPSPPLGIAGDRPPRNDGGGVFFHPEATSRTTFASAPKA